MVGLIGQFIVGDTGMVERRGIGDEVDHQYQIG